jgi:hypothetical protein
MISSLLLAAALNGQTAYTSQNPINVAACNVEPTNAVSPFGQSIPSFGTLTISFQNTNDQAVKSVAFKVSDGAMTQNIVEDGTFSTNVTIDKSIESPAFASDNGAVNCSVQAVAFADGSVWHAQ